MLNEFLQVSIPVPSQGDEWIAAEVLRDQFTTERNAQDVIDTTVETDNEIQASVELFALFLRFIAQKLDVEPQSELIEVIEKNMHATANIVTKFVQFGSSNAAFIHDPAYLDRQASKSEV